MDSSSDAETNPSVDDVTALKKEIELLEQDLKAKKSSLMYSQNQVEEYSKAGYARAVAEMENMRRVRVVRFFLGTRDGGERLVYVSKEKDEKRTYPLFMRYSLDCLGGEMEDISHTHAPSRCLSFSLSNSSLPFNGSSLFVYRI